VEDATPVLEQAARLRTAFDRGVVWTLHGRGDEQPAYERAPVVPGLLPDYAFTVGDFQGRACVIVEFSLDGGPPGLRWLHRFRPPSPAGWQPDVLGDFQEGVDCWIGRSLARVPAGTSPVWTDFSWGHPTQRWNDALQLFADDDLALAAQMLSADPADYEARALAARTRSCLRWAPRPPPRPYGRASTRPSTGAFTAPFTGPTTLTGPPPQRSCRSTATRTERGVRPGRQKPATDPRRCVRGKCRSRSLGLAPQGEAGAIL
jgi:hypothetical protein